MTKPSEADRAFHAWNEGRLSTYAPFRDVSEGFAAGWEARGKADLESVHEYHVHPGTPDTCELDPCVPVRAVDAGRKPTP